MWLLALLGVLNAFLSFVANYMIRFSAFDITVAGVMIMASQGDGVILPAVVMLLCYNLVSPKDFAYIWITFPMAILAGYLSIWTGSFLIALIVYHFLGFLSSMFFGYFNVKYAGFIVVNFALNFFIIRVFNLFV